MAPIYLSGGLLNLVKSLGAVRFCFLRLTLLGFFPRCFGVPTFSLPLFSLAFKEHSALLNVLIQ